MDDINNITPDKRTKIVKQLNDLQEEILMIGWHGVMAKYHPDVNVDNPSASDLFKLYKHLYEDMKKRMFLKEEDVNK